MDVKYDTVGTDIAEGMRQGAGPDTGELGSLDAPHCGISYAAVTDVGLRKKTNQDSYCARVMPSRGGQAFFAIVCDGVGGLSYGEMASAYVVEAFSRWFSTEYAAADTPTVPNEIAASWAKLISACNSSIYAKAKALGSKIGTTLTAILVYEGYGFVAVNIGDSRIYWMRDAIKQITNDHTAAQAAIAAGELTAETALHDKRKNVLTRCVGAFPEVAPDFFKGSMATRDLILLCSDGLRGKVSDTELYQLLSPFRGESSADMSAILRDIIETGKSRGEKDNITAILARLA
ncbi:MAG: protein phosphatase 2C domain-containing protein [Clostridiales Family XIII bacterium]|jgi:serine/threonine protein phosphatase PrpC|nr:protein phosphatase 2C domain-containing protein [Clostridiales Family XIII bacterium]